MMRKTAPIRVVFERLTSWLHDKQYQLNKQLHVLRYLTLEITSSCNLNCMHCYARSGTRELSGELGTDEIFRLIDQAVEHYGPQVVFAITGGEPLCRPDLFEILEYLRQKGVAAGLSTNGTLIDDANAPRLAGLLGAISIDLDGIEKHHNHLRNTDCFSRVLEAIRRVKGFASPQLTIKSVIYRDSLEDLPALMALIADIKPFAWHVFPIEPRGEAALHPELHLDQAARRKLYRQVADFSVNAPCAVLFEEGMPLCPGQDQPPATFKKRCYSGIDSLAVLPDGGVSACVCGPCLQKDQSGNIREKSLLRIWEEGFKENRGKCYRSCATHCY